MNMYYFVTRKLEVLNSIDLKKKKNLKLIKYTFQVLVRY